MERLRREWGLTRGLRRRTRDHTARCSSLQNTVASACASPRDVSDTGGEAHLMATTVPGNAAQPPLEPEGMALLPTRDLEAPRQRQPGMTFRQGRGENATGAQGKGAQGAGKAIPCVPTVTICRASLCPPAAPARPPTRAPWATQSRQADHPAALTPAMSGQLRVDRLLVTAPCHRLLWPPGPQALAGLRAATAESCNVTLSGRPGLSSAGPDGNLTAVGVDPHPPVTRGRSRGPQVGKLVRRSPCRREHGWGVGPQTS